MTDKKPKSLSISHRALIATRRTTANKLAKSPKRTVTLRIPIELNEWLNEYQHLSYPKRLTKGGLVVEGLILAYLCRGRPGEKVLSENEVIEAG